MTQTDATRTLDDMAIDHWRWQSGNPQGYASTEPAAGTGSGG